MTEGAHNDAFTYCGFPCVYFCLGQPCYVFVIAFPHPTFYHGGDTVWVHWGYSQSSRKPFLFLCMVGRRPHGHQTYFASSISEETLKLECFQAVGFY